MDRKGNPYDEKGPGAAAGKHPLYLPAELCGIAFTSAEISCIIGRVDKGIYMKVV